MKKLHTGVILFDAIDLVCISFSLGSGMAYLVRKVKERRDIDPILLQLKKESRVIPISTPVIAVSTSG